MAKITMTMRNGFILEFETVEELIEYLASHRLLGRINCGQNLVKIWEHSQDQFEIESPEIESIIIREVYRAEVRYVATHTFHNYEAFEDFMVGMGAIRPHVVTGARYGIYAGEVITSKYDCYITGVIPNYMKGE